MNDRGLQFSPVDLLKSLLLERSEQTRRPRLNEVWRKAMTGLSALGGTGAAADFVKALLVGRYADPVNADDLSRIEASLHEWIHGNLAQMALVRPANFAAFITEEFAPFAEAYCTLFSAAQSPDSNMGLHKLFFNNVNGIRKQFQLIFAAVRRGDSVSPTSLTCSTSAALSPGTRPIPPNSTSPSVSSSPNSAAPPIWKRSLVCSAPNCRSIRSISPTSRRSDLARITAGRSTIYLPGSPPSSRPSAAAPTG